MTAQKPLIVMPTYNERENLPRIVAALFALEVPALEILVVDDDSPDGTGQLAEALRAEYDEKVHVLHRKEKKGLGPAYIDGYRRAIQLGADVIVQMDADFSHQPKYVPQLIEKTRTHDLVVGTRYKNGGGVDPSWGLHRKALSWWANRIYTPAILRLPVSDATGGFKAWRRETLAGMDLDQMQSKGYVFGVEMTYVAHRLGYTIAEVPIYFPDRQHGESKMDSSIALEAAISVWRLLLRYRSLNPSKRLKNEHISTLTS